MANLGQKNGIYHVRFRFDGTQYKKSLKTRDVAEAEVARKLVEVTIHRLLTGQIAIPAEVEPGDFILSGGKETACVEPIEVDPEPTPDLPSTKQLIEEFKDSQRLMVAESYHDSQALHLRHFVRHLGDLANVPCDRVGHNDLDCFLKARLEIRDSNTVKLERITLMQFYKWVVAKGHLATSPAARLEVIRGGEERPPFRTIAEIERIIARGGLDHMELLDLWECLYLSPEEIARLLVDVRSNARDKLSVILHAIPAYTGMRRSEVLRLRWLDVDLDSDFLIARSRKQSRSKRECSRQIDIHPELKSELLAWRELRPKGQFVVCDARSLQPISKDQANRLFWQPMNSTEWCLDQKRHWYKIGFHTYRHSFVSNLAARGVDQRVIDEFTGHTTDSMRKRYRHIFPKTRRSAIECFSLSTSA